MMKETAKHFSASRLAFGEVILVNRPDHIGFSGPDADLVLNHQPGKAITVDQHNALLHAVQVVAGVFGKIGCGDEDAFAGAFAGQ